MLGSIRDKQLVPRISLAWLALFALAFHSLLPLTYHSLQRRQAAQAGFDRVVICTPYGLRMVQLGVDGQPLLDQDAADKDKPAQDKAARYCPICLAAQQVGMAILPQALAIALPLLLAEALYPVRAQAPPIQAEHQIAQARAPPVFFPAASRL